MTTDDPDKPYSVLGVTRQSSWDEIRRTHRKLLSANHPDRFVGQDPEIIANAELRVRDINEAFSAIRRQRSLSTSSR